MEFNGYGPPDDGGARNDVAVIPSVTCSMTWQWQSAVRSGNGDISASPGVLPAASGSGAGDGYADQFGLKS